MARIINAASTGKAIAMIPVAVLSSGPGHSGLVVRYLNGVKNKGLS